MSGMQGEDSAWVTVNFTAPAPSDGHWVALFSPADFGYVIRLFFHLKILMEFNHGQVPLTLADAVFGAVHVCQHLA